MSKVQSRIWFLVGVSIVLLATAPLVSGLLGSTFSTVYPPSGGVVHELIAFGNPALFWLAIGMYIMGGIVAFVGYLGALIRMAQLEQWIWFVLLLVFNFLTMLVYIFVGPENHARRLPPFYARSG